MRTFALAPLLALLVSTAACGEADAESSMNGPANEDRPSSGAANQDNGNGESEGAPNGEEVASMGGDPGGTTQPASAKHEPNAPEVQAFWKEFKNKDVDIAKEWAKDDGGRAWAGDFLAFHESLRQVALVDMYYATKSTEFLDEAERRMRVVLSLRDNQKNQKDVIRGKVLPSWGRYPDTGGGPRKDLWTVEMQQVGMITYPMAMAMKAIHDDAALKPKYGAFETELRDALVLAIDAFDGEWTDASSEGFYKFPKGYGRVWPAFEGAYLPYNRPLGLGRAMAYLVDVGVPAAKSDKYKERVKKLGAFFKGDTHKSGSHVVWNFATWNTSAENFSHAAIDASFIAIAGRYPWSGISKSDVNDFIASFEFLTKNPMQIASYVDGSGGGNGTFDAKDANQSCGRWLELADWVPKLTKNCGPALAAGFDSKQVGEAKVLRYGL